MRAIVVAAVALLVIVTAGLLAWRAVGPPHGGSGPDLSAQGGPDDALPEQLAELRQLLEDERDARRQLAARLELLGARLAALDAASAAPADESESSEAGIAIVDGPEAAGGDTGARDDVAARGAFDEEKLIAAGLTASEAAWLHEKWEQRQLNELYLGDQAARERWGFRRLNREREAARRELQDQIGLDMYDSMLYAAGGYNRVVVRDLYAGSAAENAGLRVGDQIVRYADSPVFEVRDLRRLTRGGEAGELVQIEVARSGGIERLQVERGPLGVLLGRDRAQPGLQ